MEKDGQHTVPNVLKEFAHLLGTEIQHNRLDIPSNFGKGYCVGFVFNEYIRMMILNYELKNDLVVKNPDMGIYTKNILFKFQNIFPEKVTWPAEKQLKATPSVLITTTSLNQDVLIPIHSNTATINIEVDADYLSKLFQLSGNSPVLQGLLQNTQPLSFEQVLYPFLQKIVNEILFEPIDGTFKLFFLRVKAEELICRLLIELEKRNEKQLYALNSKDVQTIYKIKEQILARLETPPMIKELSISAHMSPTKLKRLFKQFSATVFSIITSNSGSMKPLFY